MENDDIIRAVKCDICGKLHDISTETFVTVRGNILLGYKKYVIGPNMIECKTKEKNIFCKGNCFRQAVKSLIADESNTRSPFHDPLQDSLDGWDEYR